MKKLSIFAILVCIPFFANASELGDAIANVRSACGGISDEMGAMKTMAGINTAITGVGTVAGGVALGSGFAKENIDNEIEEWERILDELEVEQEKAQIVFTVINPEDVSKALQGMRVSSIDVGNQLAELNDESKKLGNIRTVTMAGATATNIAGAVIAGGNKVKGDLKSQINECISATKTLSNVRMQARIDGSASNEELDKSQDIITKCSTWETVDLSKIDNRAKGATISSAIGATTGVAGTITSASANSDKVRDDNSNDGKQKEKNLNTASNVLAGATTAASATATVFNATQISAIKRAASVADECEGALK